MPPPAGLSNGTLAKPLGGAKGGQHRRRDNAQRRRVQIHTNAKMSLLWMRRRQKILRLRFVRRVLSTSQRPEPMLCRRRWEAWHCTSSGCGSQETTATTARRRECNTVRDGAETDRTQAAASGVAAPGDGNRPAGRKSRLEKKVLISYKRPWKSSTLE